MVTVIIPARHGQQEIKALEAAQKLDYPPERLEILVARGRHPAVQRNRAIHAAKGDIVYFLDDDSVPAPDNLKRALKHFQEPDVVMVGGPNLCPPEAPFLEQVFSACMASWLAFGPSCARYDSVGNPRDTSEKELILCNQLARRQALLDLGGFDEALYPNEENALMDELQKRGGRLRYDPALVVYRRPRQDLKSFWKMVMTYGRGRAEQFRRHPTYGSILNMAPPFFVLYLVCMAILAAARHSWFKYGLILLGLYCIAVVGQTLVSIPRKGILRSIFAMPLLVLTHLGYGIGFLRGLFTRLEPPPPQISEKVELEKVR